MASDTDDLPMAVLFYTRTGHDGAGWYYVDDEYRDEGSVGAFATREKAIEHARAADYRIAPICEVDDHAD
jgi:predicted GNAT family acetyltransferase